MSIKTTQKEVKQNFKYVIAVGYCDMQEILQGFRPIAHMERREGWAADVYDFGYCAIVTGYAPFGNVKPTHAECRAFVNMVLRRGFKDGIGRFAFSGALEYFAEHYNTVFKEDY